LYGLLGRGADRQKKGGGIQEGKKIGNEIGEAPESQPFGPPKGKNERVTKDRKAATYVVRGG